MAFIRGKLIRDARLLDGRESDGGHLHLRGEIVSVHPDFGELIDTRRTKRRQPSRTNATDKQASPAATKTA